ncbi:hypothetical protein CTI12_AA296570 [Artemisia annua]|uniref:Leucine-rich repeat-containing N-terminal plant-type domain-containing protein n=1 Tax=Artemisia annua TaxID=35608 RepID=A0A2U1N7V9_ARTAN|nr:hypothetical protein CTI12_AA296570 [Artemisia annua]
MGANGPKPPGQRSPLLGRIFGGKKLLSFHDEFISEKCENETLVFENMRIKDAYVALQAWKHAILSDPQNLTRNWVGPDVCGYTGVFCAPAPDNYYSHQNFVGFWNLYISCYGVLF